jgi:hypothetical protein
MKVDFTPSDRALVESAASMIRAALKKAASAARAVGHQDFPYTTDLAALEAFERRYVGKVGKSGEQKEAVRIECPEPECVIMRQGIILLLNKHQGTESTLQEELALTDPSLSDRLGDLRGLAMRFGGQPSIFDPKTSDEKAAMAAETGLPGAAVGAPPRKRLQHKKAKDDGRGKNTKRKK